MWRAPQGQVEAIYRQNYWNALRCDDLPAGVDYAVFDYGVNSGIGRAAKVLQRLVATAVDGEVGPDTIAATKRANAAALIERICSERLAFLQGLRTGRPSARAGAGACAQPNPGASAKNREAPARFARRLGIGTGVAAAIGAAAHWAGSHPILTAGAVVVAALFALVVIRRFAKGD